jgi:hypothetical protein
VRSRCSSSCSRCRSPPRPGPTKTRTRTICASSSPSGRTRTASSIRGRPRCSATRSPPLASTRSPSKARIPSFRVARRSAETGSCSSRSSRAKSSTRSESHSRSSRKRACTGIATCVRGRRTAPTTGTWSAARCGSSRAICSEAASTSTSAGSNLKTIAAGGGTRRLDAVRVEWEGGPDDAFGAELALASELGPSRSDLDRVEADERIGFAFSDRSPGTPLRTTASSSSPVRVGSLRPLTRGRQRPPESRGRERCPAHLAGTAGAGRILLGVALDPRLLARRGLGSGRRAHRRARRPRRDGTPPDRGNDAKRRLGLGARRRSARDRWPCPSSRASRSRTRSARATTEADGGITPIGRAIFRPTRRASAASGASPITVACSTPSSRTSPSQRPQPASPCSSPARSRSSTTTTA